VYQRPNLLLLDEPTNHLDLDMREGLTEALNDFDGAVVLVAHDRALIRACCDTLLHVGGGSVVPYDGDLDDYARLVMRSEKAPAAATAQTGSARRDERKVRADERARLAPLRKQVQQLEKKIAQVDANKRQADAALADPSLYEGAQTERVQELSRLATTLAAELDALEMQWLQAHAELEAAND
jgi:ATP-binding cassette subfamily F protein 3